ncbi:MAG TPA: hypothetical protein VJ919_04585 [Tangfeifania sp.]|nr:hypothetical protein [Tangfeifania sp.]
MDKFQNIYRIESARLKIWDYGRNAWYFVTICTGQRSCFFGNINDGKMKYSPAGNIARQLWMVILNQFDYANLAEYIVMPNHIHGIIQINKPNPPSHPHPEKYNRLKNDVGGDVQGGRDAINRVSTVDRTINDPNKNDSIPNVPTTDDRTTIASAPKNPGGITGNYNPMLHDNLSRIIRWYKGRVTFEVRKITNGFSWQSRFYDRIIRNEEQLNRVRKYIINNPRNWSNDEWYIP